MTFKPEESVTYCHVDLPGIRFKDVYGNKPYWAYDVRSDDGSGLPPMPSIRNLEGTRHEIMLVERHFKFNWDSTKSSDMGGLIPRHRQEVIRYIGRIAKYALAIGLKPEHIEESIKVAIKFPEYP